MDSRYSNSRRYNSQKNYHEKLTPLFAPNQPKNQRAVRTGHSKLIAQMLKYVDTLVQNSDPVYGMKVEAQMRKARGLGKHDLLVNRF